MSKKTSACLEFIPFDFQRDSKIVFDAERELKKLECRTFLLKKIRDSLKRHYEKEPEGFFIAIYQGEQAGCLILETKYDPWISEKFIFGRLMFLHPAYRHRNLSRFFMAKMERYAKERKISLVYHGTHANNITARGIFERFGYDMKWVYYQKRIDL